MPDPEISSAGGGFAFGITVEGSAEAGAPDNTEMQQMQEAGEACNHFLEGVVQEFERPDMSEMQDQMLAFSQCMREHGVDMPDPEFSEDGAVTIFGPGTRASHRASTPATRPSRRPRRPATRSSAARAARSWSAPEARVPGLPALPGGGIRARPRNRRLAGRW